MSLDQSVNQACNVVPPRIAYIVVVTVDSTSRGYDLTKLAFFGAHNGQGNQMYWSLQNDGANDIYYALDSAAVGVNEISDTAILAAGSTLAFDSPGAGLATCMCAKINAGIWKDERIDHLVDKTLILKCAAGNTSTIRIWLSSQPMAGVG